MLAFIMLTEAGSWSRADDPDNSTTSAAPAPWVNRPLLSTNAAASTFLESHPELAQPAANQQSLSSPPEPTPDESSSRVSPSASAASPEAFPALNPIGEPEDLAAHLLVVYNQNDPDSKSLADYYASRRNIPPERILAIACPTTEEITHAQYDETIRAPIISYLSQKNWITRQSEQVLVGNRMMELLIATRNDIWAIVLMRGVPLKIAPDPSDDDSMEPGSGLQTNAAAVDSELALLPVFGLPEGGFVPNAFFDSNETGVKRVGADLATKIVLVTRLDGPKPDDVRRMIDDSLYAERNRLAGLAVIDSRGLTDAQNNYTTGDVWLRSARDMLVRDGWCVKFDDKPEVLPPTDPCNDVALYLGWYAENATGPWVIPPNRFVRGAIAYHLFSFSAATVRSDTSYWVGPLIAHGAAATMGTVYEPYLALTPHLDIFTKRLLDGDYFAEAAYASEGGLSWMVTVIGDPLYRPFRQPLDSALANAGDAHTEHDDWLLLQEVQRELAAGQIEAKSDVLAARLDVPGSGAVAAEGLGDLLEKLNVSVPDPWTELAYRKAMALYSEPVDRIRLGLKLAHYFINCGQDDQAQTELKTLRELDPQDADRFGVAQLPVSTGTPANFPVVNPSPVQAPSPPSVLPTLSKPPLPPLPQQTSSAE